MAPQMSNRIKYPYYYRVSNPYIFGKALVNILKKWKVKRVAIVKSYDIQMSVTAEDYVTELNLAGIEIVTVITVLNEDVLKYNFNAYYTELKRKVASFESTHVLIFFKGTNVRYIVTALQQNVGQINKFFWSAWNVSLPADVRDLDGRIIVPQNFSLIGKDYVYYKIN
jgi:ABC-type branched-subunit amino acid transport system substrate-binding protein